MAILHFARREVEAKIVYWGPALSGKTTNIRSLHRLVSDHERGELQLLDTAGDRTLFFDYLPLARGEVAGFKARFKVYSVPGQPVYRDTRRQIIRGVDAVVFVADSSPDRIEENLESLEDLKDALRGLGRGLEDTPVTLQFNKRDLPGALSLDKLEECLNPYNLPSIPSTATEDHGVLETLELITRQVSSRVGRDLASNVPQERLKVAKDNAESSESADVQEQLDSIGRVRAAEERRLRSQLHDGEMRGGASDFAARYSSPLPSESSENVFEPPSDRILFVPSIDRKPPPRPAPHDAPTDTLLLGTAPTILEDSSASWRERQVSENPFGSTFSRPQSIERLEAFSARAPESDPADDAFGEMDPTMIIPVMQDPSAPFTIIEERPEDFRKPGPLASMDQESLDDDELGSPTESIDIPPIRLEPQPQSPPILVEPPVRSAPSPSWPPPPVAPQVETPLTSGEPPVRTPSPRSIEDTRPRPAVAEDSGVFPAAKAERLVLPFLSPRFVGFRIAGMHGARLGADGSIEVKLLLSSRISESQKPVVLELQAQQQPLFRAREWSLAQILLGLFLIFGLGTLTGAILAWYRLTGGMVA